MASVNKSINTFSLNLYKELSSSNNEKSVFCSPISVASVLSMLNLGARGDTQRQIKKVLEFGEFTEARVKPPNRCENPAQGIQQTQRVQKQTAPPRDEVGEEHQQFQNILHKLTSLQSETELKIANGMFAQDKFPLLQQYVKSVQLLYQAKLESVDFQKDESRKEINKWVEHQTKDKIKDLFPPNSIDRNAVMILVSAIYFKGLWENPFDVENTKESPFYVNKDVVVSVPMMNQTAKFNVGILDDLGAKILDIPYRGGELSMFILLTDERFGLEKIEHQITAESLALWTKRENMVNTRYDVYLPRFKLEESYNLGPNLVKMGMVDAFSQQKADLSGISKVGLYVSKVLHKAYIDVNEEGTEAAAGTGAVIIPKMLPPTFKVDHPFYFAIKHNETNTILFNGKLMSP